jgi:small subunit ribosomal protein S2
MALPTFTMRQMLEAGVHFGHVTRRWDPKMEQFIFGTRQKIHILDLQQTVPMMYRAMQAVNDAVAGGGRVLWVGTKRQAAEPVAEAAKRCGQYYVNHRWLGGMMTNWKTISNSIRRLKTLEEQLSENNEETMGLTKKEMLKLTREHEKLDRSLGGIKDMGGLPDIVFVLDTNKESIAVAEANKLGIPVIGILDSNSDPDGIDFPIPGNDDSIRAISFYCDMIAGSVLSGIQTEMAVSGADLGELEITPTEELLGDAAVEVADVVKENPSEVSENLNVTTEKSEATVTVDNPAPQVEQDTSS